VDEPLAWLYQARADREAAEREYTSMANAHSRVWCHAVAKYQQAVEKAVKSIVAGLREAGFWHGPPIGFVHEVERHMRWLVRLPRGGDQHSVQRSLVRLFDSNTRAGIRSLQALVPQAPSVAEPLRRNTEYPFQDADGQFTYPAKPEEFSPQEVDQFRALSHRLVESAHQVISALRRRPK
jgi:hypothetical protein